MAQDPRFADFATRAAYAAALCDIVGRIFLGDTTEGWLARLRAADILADRVNGFDDWLADPHVVATGGAVPVDQPGMGQFPTPRTPGVPLAVDAALPPAPRIGEHGAAILAELGVDFGDNCAPARREHPADPGGVMTENFDLRRHRYPESRYFEDLRVGEHFFIPSRTMTEAHFAAFQTVSADNHPIHYDVEYCRERGHPGPLAHGFQILCFTAAGASYFALAVGDALIAFIEQSSKFLKPVYPGDTLYPMLEIAALTPQRSTGVVTLAATVHNQNELSSCSPANKKSCCTSGQAGSAALDDFGQQVGGAAAPVAIDIEVGDGAQRARAKSGDQHPCLLGAFDDRRGVRRTLLHTKDHDIGLHRREIEADAAQTRQPFCDEPRIVVVFAEPRQVVVERIEAGGGENARLPHRAAEHPPSAPSAHNSGVLPAIRLPTGQPSPFDNATETRSNGAASSARLRPVAAAALNSRAPSR